MDGEDDDDEDGDALLICLAPDINSGGDDDDELLDDNELNEALKNNIIYNALLDDVSLTLDEDDNYKLVEIHVLKLTFTTHTSMIFIKHQSYTSFKIY